MKSIMLVLLFSVATPIAAQEIASTAVVKETSTSTEQKGLSFGAGLDSTSFNYVEPGLMKVTGQLFGFNLDGAYQFNSVFGVSGRYNYLSGPATYDGQLAQSGTPVKSNDNYKITDAQLLGHVLVASSNYLNASLYAGTGRRVTEDLNDPTPSDYYRKHIYNYFSAGISFDFPTEPFMTNFSVGFHRLYSGQSITKLSDVNPEYGDFDLSLKDGSALNLSLLFSTAGTSTLLYAGLDYKKWSIPDSTSALTVMDGATYRIREPKNETTTLAVKAGLIF